MTELNIEFNVNDHVCVCVKRVCVCVCVCVCVYAVVHILLWLVAIYLTTEVHIRHWNKEELHLFTENHLLWFYEVTDRWNLNPSKQVHIGAADCTLYLWMNRFLCVISVTVLDRQ